ncbi:MAG: leucyl aminopeptidase family protein, partial [Parasphingorhabdus sp.]
MTDFKPLIEADSGQPARTIQILDVNNFEDWLKGQPESIRAIVAAYRFVANPDSYLLLPPIGGKS